MVVVGDVVAVRGDAIATPTSSTTVGQTGWSGVWSAEPVVEAFHENLKVEGSVVIHRASCTFRFVGTDASGTPQSAASVVELESGETILQAASGNVLVHGQRARDDDGNELRIDAGGRLATK